MCVTNGNKFHERYLSKLHAGWSVFSIFPFKFHCFDAVSYPLKLILWLTEGQWPTGRKHSAFGRWTLCFLGGQISSADIIPPSLPDLLLATVRARLLP